MIGIPLQIRRPFFPKAQATTTTILTRRDSTSVLSGAAYVDELLHGHEREAFEVFRMPITVFEDLCAWLRTYRGEPRSSSGEDN
jgi:hypothetical protein